MEADLKARSEHLARRRQALIGAGLPGNPKKIIGKKFLFIYYNTGRMEISVEGVIRSVSYQTGSTMKIKDNVPVVQLTPDPCAFFGQEVAFFEGFPGGNWNVNLKNKQSFNNESVGVLYLVSPAWLGMAQVQKLIQRYRSWREKAKADNPMELISGRW